MPDLSRPKRPRKFRVDEIADILSKFKVYTKEMQMGVYESCAKIAEEYGRTQETIYGLVRRFNPSTDAAEALIKANALRLAVRVVRKANVDQAIDILSRPNMGVLQPTQQAGSGGGGFFLSVQADSCGAVVKVATVQPGTFESLQKPIEGLEASYSAPASAPYSGASATSEHTIEGEVVHHVAQEGEQGEDGEESRVEPRPSMSDAGVPHPNQGHFGRFSKPKADWPARHQKELERARARLAEARRQAEALKLRGLL
jgi:hypothetical protein